MSVRAAGCQAAAGESRRGARFARGRKTRHCSNIVRRASGWRAAFRGGVAAGWRIAPLARSLAILEALVGQLYPAILLGRLVSLQVQEGGSR